MTFKNKTIQKFISSIIVISMFVPAIFLLSAPQKAQAIPVFDIPHTAISAINSAFSGTTAVNTTTSTVISVKNVAQEIAKQILMTVARRLLKEMTKSTVNWINSGFHGSPLFLENPKSFFKDIAKSEVKNFVNEIGYNSLRFPFGKQVALNVINSYKTQALINEEYTLSRVINDPYLLNRYRNDFNFGGWNGFLINTQYPQNNYLGYQLMATDRLAQALQGTTQTAAQGVRETLQQGMGFLSPQTCSTNPAYSKANETYNQFNKPSFVYKVPRDDAYQNAVNDLYNNPDNLSTEAWQVAWNGAERSRIDYETRYDAAQASAKTEWEKTNVCPPKPDGSPGLVNTTPGSVVGAQITKALGGAQDQASLAAALGNSLSAVFDALINHFMEKGLNALASKINPQAPKDNWDYYGNTLGSPTNANSNDIWSGPDQEIILSDFKTEVADGIANTTLELALMGNIAQTISQTWPKIRELDMCLPGPDINWEERTDNEMNRNSQKLQGKLNDSDGEKAAAAQLTLNALKFAVDLFKDWVNTKMMASLPSAIIYMDEVKGIDTLYQQSDELTSKKRTKAQALARLEAIQTALTTFTVQPTAGTQKEKDLITINKQYQAVKNSVSNTASIEDARNELAISKEKLLTIDNKDPDHQGLLQKCVAERTVYKWSNPGGRDSKLAITPTIAGTEQNIFCDWPINHGYSHDSFINPNPVLPEYKDLPMVNANKVFTYKGALGLIGHQVNIKMSCNIIYRTNVTEYKKNLPGPTTVVEPPPLPDDTGEMTNSDDTENQTNSNSPSPDGQTSPPIVWTPELQRMFDRYNELLIIRSSRPGGDWTSADYASGLGGEFASLLNSLQFAYNAGLVCLLSNRFVPLGTPSAQCPAPAN